MRWIRTWMEKKIIHRAALRRVQVGRRDGWRVWTEWLDCCCGGCAHKVGVLIAIEACNLIRLCVRSVSEQCLTESRGMKRDVPAMKSEETSRRKGVHRRLSSEMVCVYEGKTLG